MTDWDKAHCADLGIGTEVFYPDDNVEDRGRDVNDVIGKVCAFCPIQRECLDYAVVNRERYGIWGGTLPAERQRMIRRELGIPKWRWDWPETPIAKRDLSRCARSHDMDEWGYISGRGQRLCRLCRREDNVAYNARLRERRNAS